MTPLPQPRRSMRGGSRFREQVRALDGVTAPGVFWCFRRLWGVNRMGTSLRDRCGSAAQLSCFPSSLPWPGSSGEPAPPTPRPADSGSGLVSQLQHGLLRHDTASTLEEASAAAKAVTQPLQPVAALVMATAGSVPGNSPTGVTQAGPLPASHAVATVADTAAAVLNQGVTAVTTVATTAAPGSHGGSGRHRPDGRRRAGHTASFRTTHGSVPASGNTRPGQHRGRYTV